MYHVGIILVLILLSFVGYKTMYPTKEKTPNPSSVAIVLPDKEPITQRPVATWLPPCSSRIVGKFGPPLKCCGDFYADNIYIKPEDEPYF